MAICTSNFLTQARGTNAPDGVVDVNDLMGLLVKCEDDVGVGLEDSCAIGSAKFSLNGGT